MLQPRYGQQVSTEDLYKNNKEIQKQDQEYNIDPKIDYAKSIESSVRYGVSQGDPVGDVFAPYGGVKGVDEDLDIQDLYDIPEARAQEQSGWDRFGNFTANMAIEAGLGSVEALGYMADMVNYEGLAKEAEDGFDSEFGKYFREIKEQAQENFPIYMTAKAQQGTLIEKMSEPSYWASQGKTVGTTLSLMLPGLGIAKGVGTGAKMLGAGLRASQAIGSAAAGLSSRLAESAMEANQQFQQNYAKYLAEEQAKGTGDTQAEVIARQRAGNIAANTFKGNMYLAPLDMLQYGLALNPSLLKTFNNLKKGIPGVVNTGIQMGSEAAEEGFQYVAGQEAISTEEKGTDFLGGEGFGNRLSEYIKEPEFQESALLGGLMGGLFEGIGKLSKAQNFVTDKIEAVKTKNEIRSGELNRDKLISDIGAGIDGDILDKQRSRYNSIIETKLGQENIDVDLKSSIENNSKTINDAFEYAQTESDNLESDDRFKNNPELRKELLKAKVASKVNQDYLKKLTNDVSELKSTLTEDIGEDGVKYLENEAGIATAKELIQETKKDKKLTPEKKKEQIAVLEVKKDRLEAANKELKKENPELSTTSSYSDQYKKYQKSFNKTKYTEDIKIKPAIADIEALGAIKAAEAEESLKKESSTNRNKKATSRIKSNEDPDIIKADFIKEGGTAQEFNKLVDDVASKEPVPKMVDVPDKGSSTFAKKRYEKAPQTFKQDKERLANILDKSPDGKIVAENIRQARTPEEFDAIIDTINNEGSKEFKKLFKTIIRNFYNNKQKSKQTPNPIKPENIGNKGATDSEQNIEEKIHNTQKVPLREQETLEVRALQYVPKDGSIELEEGKPKLDTWFERTFGESINYDVQDKLKVGDELSLEVPFDNLTRGYTSENNIPILIKKDGEIVGYLPASGSKNVQPNMQPVIDKIRKKVYSGVDLANATQKSFKTVVTHKTGGVYLPYKTSRFTPVKHDGQYALGIVGYTKNYFTDAASKIIEKAGINLNAIPVGKVFQIIQDLSGKYVVHSLYTESLEKNLVAYNRYVNFLSKLPKETNPTVIKVTKNAMLGIAATPDVPRLSEKKDHIVLTVNSLSAKMQDKLSAEGINFRIVSKQLAKNKSIEVYEVSIPLDKLDSYLKDENFNAVTDLIKSLERQVDVKQFNSPRYVDSILKGDPDSATDRPTLVSRNNPEKIFGNSTFFIDDVVEDTPIDPEKVTKSENSDKKKVSDEPLTVDNTIKETPEVVGAPEYITTETVDKVIPEENPVEKPSIDEPADELNIDNFSIDDLNLEDLPDAESKILPSIPDDLEATGEGIDFKLNYTEGYKQWDKAKEIQWLKNKLSKVEFESITEENNVRNDIKNLAPKGANVWGYVKEAVIYLSEAAGVGTTYHEAFHIVSKYMLSDRQRIALYNEAKKEFGNLSDKLLEERLADKFMEYVESEGTDTSVKGRIKSFFKRLYTWIKYKLGGNLSIDEVFYAINTGTFNSVEPDPRNVSKFKEPIFKRIANFSPDKQEKASEMLSTMWSRTIDEILDENPKFKNSKRIDVVNSLGVDYLAKKVMAKLINHRKELLKIGNSNADDLKVIFAKWYNHETKLFGDMGELAFRKIKEREGYKINVKSKFKLANTEGNPEQKQTEDETQLEGWQIDVQSTPGESGLSHEIRSLLYNIPMTINGTKYGDKYWGYQTNINGKQAYDLLSRNLADIFNIDVMMEKLNELSLHPDKEFTKQVIQRLEADSTLKTQFYTNMAMTHAEMGVIQNFYGEWKYYAGNRNSVDKMIVSEWETSANNTWMKTGKPELKQLDTVSTIGEAVKVFNSIGLTLKESDFAGKIGKKERFTLAKDDINYIIKGLNAGNNIFEDNISNLNNLGYIIKDNRLGLVESSYVGADGKKKYSINIPSFFAKQLYKIKQGDLEMYKSDPFYSESPMYKDLLDNTGNILDTLDYSLMDGLKYNQKKDGIPYAKMTKKDFEVYKINAYHNNGKKVGLFSMPILSDSPSSIYIKLPKLNTNLVFDKLTEVAFQEYYRIQQLEQDIKDKKIKNYDKNYSKFHFFPFLTMADFAGDLAEDNIKMKLINELTKKYDTYKEFITTENVLNKEDNYGISKDALEKQSEDSFLRDYYFNDFYYRTQLITMTTGDPSFYKNATDFFKRAKEIWSPGLVLNTSAEFTTESGDVIQTGKTFNSVYLTDVEEFMEELGTQVFDILSGKAETPDQQIRAAKIAAAYGYSNRIENKGTKDEQRFVDIEVELNGEGKKVSFLSKKVNVADAQAFISPSRYRKVQIGLGRWTNNLNSVLDKLIAEEKLSFEDTASVMQPLKPFYFGHIKSGNKVIPVQNKNSEYMLLPELVNKSPRLKALYEKMTTNNIDSFQFESAVKAGLSNDISIDNLNELTVDNIHVLNNADYSLQQETPEHYLDADNLYGTQYRKLLLADIDPNASFDIDGKSYTRDELVNEYQELIIANLAESYDKAHKELGFDLTDRKERNKMLSAMLVKEVQAKEYGNDIEEAVSLDKNGEFNLPLFDTLHSDRIEKMLTSIYRNNVTKQKIKGGSFVQTSNVGFMDDLELKISDGRLEYAEVYLPEWTREYFADRDITNIPEELREMIGYRIPTEDKYSMLPLRVKGFLPSNAGGAIMLPSAITTMAGSDFDVDKLYVLMPEFKNIEGVGLVKNKYSTDDANLKLRYVDYIDSLLNTDQKQEYFEEVKLKSDRSYAAFKGHKTLKGKKYGEALKEGYQSIFDFLDLVDIPEISKDIKLYVKQYNGYDLKIIEKLQLIDSYTNNKIKEHSDYSIYLQNEEDVESKVIHQSVLADGYAVINNKINNVLEELQELKKDKDDYSLSISTKLKEKFWNDFKVNRVEELVKRYDFISIDEFSKLSYTEQNLKKARNNRLLDISKAILTHPDTFSKTMKPGGFEDYQRYANIVSILRDSNKGYTFNQLNAMSDENLSDLAQEILDKKDDITVADPLSQIKMFNRNMSGAALIGIFANHNVNHAVLQFTDAEFDTPFLFDNKPYAKLNQAYIDGNRVMESLSQLLAASVDNAKDPNAFKANISTITADIAATMLRLGIPMETMIGFMGQPVIAHYLKLVDKYGGNFAAQDKAKQEILKVLGRQKQSNISTNDLYNSLKDKWNSGIQKDVFNNFLLYQELSTDLATVVRATRADATGAGPKLANNEKYINDMDKARSVESIKGLEDLWNGGVYPMVKSFYDLGIAKPNEDMNKLFWYDHPVIKGIKDEVRSKTGANLSPEDLDKLNSHIYTYFMSNCDILPFNDRDMAKKIIYDTPALLEKLKAKYANKYKVLKYLKVKNDRKSPFARIEFNALTSVTPTLIDELKASFMDMFYEKEIDVKDGKSDVRKLAENLLLYTYFRMGSVYGGNSFANVVPTEFYLKDTVGRLIREYKMQLDPETSGNFIKSEDYANFADQFIRNNWMNGKYVPKISTDLNEIQQRELSASKVPYWVKVNSKKGNFTDGEVNGVPQFKSYLSYPVVTVKGKKTNVEWVLMKMVKSQGGVAVYSPYNGLGYPATLVEYNMSGINESMVASNNVNKEIINKGFSLAKSLNLSTKLDNINTQEDIDNLKCVTGK